MIFVADFFMTFGQHAPFNAAFLAVLSEAYPSERIVFFADPGHIQQLGKLYNFPDQVHFEPVKVDANTHHSKSAWLKKFWNEFRLLNSLFRKADQYKPNKIFFCFLSPVAQYVLSRRKLAFETSIVLHGLDVLNEGSSKPLVQQLFAGLIKRAFKKKQPNKYYVVLEQNIKTYLMNRGFLKSEELLLIHHPYIFENMDGKRFSGEPIVFAHLGVARLSKKSDLFFRLADYFRAEVEAGVFEFRLVGSLLPEMTSFINPWVRIYEENGKYLSQELYSSLCREAHYAVFCYPEDAYTLSSSGAILDALKYNLPVLAVRNSYFEEISRDHQDAFILFDNFAALRLGIENISSGKNGGYDTLRDSIEKMKNYYRIESVARELTAQLPGVLK